MPIIDTIINASIIGIGSGIGTGIGSYFINRALIKHLDKLENFKKKKRV